MSEQTAKHGRIQDEYLEQQTRGGAGHVEEFHQIEPGALDDDPDRPGHVAADEAPGGMTQDEIDLRARIAATLGRGAFPGDRSSLLDVARGNGADDGVLAWLGRLPAEGTFENMQAVSRAVGIATEPPEAPRPQ